MLIKIMVTNVTMNDLIRDPPMHTHTKTSLENHYDEIADAIAQRGFIILDNAFPDDISKGLIDVMVSQETQLQRAGIGRGKDYQLDNSVRGDKIQWLENSSPQTTQFLMAMEHLQHALNRRLYLGLKEYEAHFAYYAPGAFYRKHRDAFRGQPGRKLSSVYYLNPAWPEAAGGELVIYNDIEQEMVRVAPECGRLVLFLSEDFPHEVLPATKERRSIAGWFRINSAEKLVVTSSQTHDC